MVQFHELCLVEEARFHGSFMMTCRKLLSQLCNVVKSRLSLRTLSSWIVINRTFRSADWEQNEQTWGFIRSPDDIKLTFPDRNGRNILLPSEMFVREFLDIQRPDWHREQDLGSHFIPRAFTA